MVRKQHKILCLFLCLALILTGALMSTLSVFADAGDTVYLQVSGWAAPYCYMWNSTSDMNASWPGKAMTRVADGIYSYTLPKAYANIIFSNNGDSQTGDMTYPGHGKIYNYSGNSWSDYSGAVPKTTSAGGQTATTAASGSGTTVYLKNSLGWSTPKCYMWNSSSDTNAGWPGVNMTSVGDDVWMYTASKTFANCIFNGGSDANQTSDLTAMNGYIYDSSSKQWSVYDTSDLQVTSYTADPSSNIYTGMEVTLAASATSKTGGTVTYKFSVTNSSNSTTVIQGFGTGSTATWTPSAVGTYTITFDFADTNGNENQRTLSLTVADDSTLTKPVIKGISPSTAYQIKRNTATTLTLSAGGGKTGTNLLFYKFVITDPNGTKNTAYYTLSSSYSFTPTIVGDYTVVAYAQASDNSTVSKTYTYSVTNSNVTVPPTTVKPTTAPVTTVKPTTAPVTTVKPTTKPVATTAKPTTKPVATTAKPTTRPVPTTAKTTTKPVATGSTGIWGDADGDGKVNVKDVTYIQKHIAQYPEASYLDLAVADFNADNKISIVDATLLQKYINIL